MRDENRRHRRRKIAKQERVLRILIAQDIPENLFVFARKRATTPQSCSCDMCGNPRRCCGGDHDPHRDVRQVNYGNQKRLYDQD